MDRIRIRGGRPLHGEIRIGGAKNAALPLMTAGLLTPHPSTLTNLARLAALPPLADLLRQHGASVEISGDPGQAQCRIEAARIENTTAPYDLVRKMRASVLVLGPLLARFGEARVSLPGGCAIGTRPVDLHLSALEKLGATINLEEGYIHATADRGLKGAKIVFPMVSVGATENLLMAAALADGETVLANAAREPEVGDLAQLLVAMGAEIEGIGTDTLRIRGKAELGGCSYAIVPDRIETGSYAVAAALTGGDILLRGSRIELIQSVADILTQAGALVAEENGDIRVTAPNRRMQGVDVMTEPFPGFPTDMQAQIMALATLAEGASMITETIFENRFMHVPELCRMGANINVHGHSAIVRGVDKLQGAQVMATDLRASVSLVLAALAAEGETIINRVYHLDRGYERVEEKLAACGADIERMAA